MQARILSAMIWAMRPRIPMVPRRAGMATAPQTKPSRKPSSYGLMATTPMRLNY
uniref:Uncharacterized protein n=1 Tax=Triticum urartu TaxID=4572 RepID=A0A8R7TEB1_TRIUA